MGRREPQLPCSYRALGSLVGQAVPGLGPMDDPRRDKLRIQQHIPQLSVESESIFVQQAQDVGYGKRRPRFRVLMHPIEPFMMLALQILWAEVRKALSTAEILCSFTV